MGPAAQYLVELRVQPGLNLGMSGKKKPGPGERIRRGLMARHEQGHDLVAELGVAHAPAAFFVLSMQEHRQQVTTVLAALAAFDDD